MWRTTAKILAVVGLFLGSFVYVGAVLTKFSGAGRRPLGSTKGVSIEAGEAIFWGKGKCHTCHSIGKRGSAIRCPNLGGSGPLGVPIGIRMGRRAAEISAKGRKMTPAEYLVETLTEPGAYVVEGFKDEMPVIWKPPIGLRPDELKAVMLYLSSQGGQPLDPAAIKLPEKVVAFHAEGGGAAAGTGVEELTARFGDAARGEKLFFDTSSSASCAACHRIKDRGKEIGPELTGIAGRQPVDFIIESIFEPSKVIASGYEPIEIETTEGDEISGVKKSEDAKTITVHDGTELLVIAKDDIEEMEVSAFSNMPDNFKETLQAGDFLDLLAYLLAQKE